jgi:DNA-binding transcriptional MerR regulator
MMASEQTLFDHLDAPPMPSPRAAAAPVADGEAVQPAKAAKASARSAAKAAAKTAEAKPAAKPRGPVVKADEAYRTISEVADDLDVPQHVLRFWESKFSQIRPLKRGGGRRYYRPDDVKLIRAIRTLLHHQGYTIKGVQRLLRAMSIAEVVTVAESAAPTPVLRTNGTGDAAEESAIAAADGLSTVGGPTGGGDLRLVQAALEEARALERLIGQLLPRK